MRYLLADVFTSEAFAGNQLAVLPDAEGLDARQMQAIAREFNLAETVFLTRGTAQGRFAARIFTPFNELAFAGHPTIGAAVVLSHLGRTEGVSEIVLEEAVGPVRVVLGSNAATLFMQGAAEIRPHGVAPAAFAQALGLADGCVVGTPWQASYGTPFTMVQVARREDVAAAMLIADRWAACSEGLWASRAVYVFAVIAEGAGRLCVHARMFAPKMGIVEDPATGSAAAALAGSLVTDASCIEIDQGVEMGRPSRIVAEITREGGRVSGISIGGQAVVIADGQLIRLP